MGIFITRVYGWEEGGTRDPDLKQMVTEVLGVGEITGKAETGSSIVLVRP